ncbi:MAG: adenylosuccinate synthetase, partial [Candidatus Atribacteria bacterium]|nr:adenylosuccinate synthetase [Candidatus Atribacteria bacterium]
QKKKYLFLNYHIDLNDEKIREIKDQYNQYGKMIKNYVIDGSLFLSEQLANHKNILFEGAQGTMLDVDHGTYPYVTSSNPMAGCVCTGCGISPVYVEKVIGITKAYTTRVGEGPFPTELADSIGQEIRDIGHEYGATTGRPRRCGWFDAPVVNYANRINGIKEMVLTKLDVLGTFRKIKICREYRIHNQVYSFFPADSELVQYIQPVYEELDGWMEDISHITKYGDLPANTKRYIERLESLTNSKITLISVGPNRYQTIIR